MRHIKRNPLPVTGCTLLLVLASCAGNPPGDTLLFAPDETRLNRNQQQRVVDAFASMFPLSADGTRFTDSNCGDVDPEATPVDLNDDGVFEVFIQWGNTCTSGFTGRSLSLFVRDESGNYRPQLGFPALGWWVSPIGEPKWPDLRFGGPGFCRPVWTWRDNLYQFKCSIPEEAGGCAGYGRLCEDQDLNIDATK